MPDVTIKDVAREVGVSISTVSNILNNKGRVGKETRSKVLRAAAKMNYMPNSIAVSMIVKKSNLIAVMVPDIITDFYPQVIQGTELAAKQLGLSVIIVCTDSKREDEMLLFKNRLGKMVDGIIAIPSNNDVEIYNHYKKPLVFVDRVVDKVNVDSIVIDNYQGAYMATQYLIEKGHKKIGFVSANSDMNVGKERLLGYCQALRDFKIPEKSDNIFLGDWHEETGHHAVEYYNQMSDRPTAVFAANCSICMGFQKFCIDHQISIKNDYSLIGFDDHVLANYSVPPITVISRPTIEMGEHAVQILYEKIENLRQGQSYQRIVLPVQLIERDSVASLL